MSSYFQPTVRQQLAHWASVAWCWMMHRPTGWWKPMRIVFRGGSCDCRWCFKCQRPRDVRGDVTFWPNR
jgi:hypothetical protein